MASKMPRRQFLKYVAAGAIGVGAATVVEFPLLNNTIQQDNTQIGNLNSQVSSLQNQNQQLQTQIGTATGLLSLSQAEAKLVEAIAETMIPTDSSGPGAKEAGVLYFIDRQLAGDYGGSGLMYMNGPFLKPGQSGPITVDGVTYSAGTAASRIGAAPGYQYPFNLRAYWRLGLTWLEQYSNQAYGGNFETLSQSVQTQILQDLWNNKPTNFTGPTPQEFFSELHDMVWAGFFTDPLNGGNIGMVGWLLTGFTGTNRGNQASALASSPTRLQPQSLAQYQQSAGGG